MRQNFAPYRGEFGHLIMWHAPWVNAYPRQNGAPRTVYIEHGMEAMYPSADEYVEVARKQPCDKREWLKYDMDFINDLRIENPILPPDKHPEGDESCPVKYFQPEPLKKIDVECDVAICPRNMSAGPRKNWKHWQWLSSALGFWDINVFACGEAASSDRGVHCETSWEHDRCLDATLSAFKQAKLVVATDSGLAHLAVACGKPLAMITDNLLTAPGYRMVNMRRYERCNHLKSPIHLVDCWNDHNKVEILNSVRQILGW